MTRWAPEILLYLREVVVRNDANQTYSLNTACKRFASLFPDVKLAKTQLRGYELGNHTPRADMVARLATLFGVPVMSFFVTFPKAENNEDAIREHLQSLGVVEEI